MALELTLDFQSSVPVYRQMAEEIEAKILLGKIKGNSLLPPMRELAKSFRVSLMTVRQAYRILKADGLTIANARGGTTVVSLSEKEKKDRLKAILKQTADDSLKRLSRYGMDASDLLEALQSKA